MVPVEEAVPAPPPMVRVEGEGELPSPRRVAPGAAARYPTLEEFCATFKPTPGTHEVTVVHPDTSRPVVVRFDLPRGTATVRAAGRVVVFEYGTQDVEIRFMRNGSVRVASD